MLGATIDTNDEKGQMNAILLLMACVLQMNQFYIQSYLVDFRD